MRTHQLIIGILLCCYTSFGQTSYSGNIDKYPIDLIIDINSDGNATGIYVYSNFDDPIQLDGKLAKGRLTLYEKNSLKKTAATFTFNGYQGEHKTAEGTWKNLKTGKELKISLTKNFTIEGEEGDWKDREILQPVSLKNEYFKLLLSKSKEDAVPRVSGIKIIEKKTDRLIQRLDLDCEFRDLNTVSLADYNFDGFTDFSVFESGYAGANTSSMYFLYDPAAKLFFNSGFTGVSLSFDAKTKTITEHNQCCAGRQQTTSIYKLVKNKMVLIKQHCYLWDKKKKDFTERKMKDCE
ncbi:MAG: hypothetical protein JWP81_4508 [Ferruginibacter sp.]|nr:hypothetical protein [Ferruginibacter sp.]